MYGSKSIIPAYLRNDIPGHIGSRVASLSHSVSWWLTREVCVRSPPHFLSHLKCTNNYMHAQTRLYIRSNASLPSVRGAASVAIILVVVVHLSLEVNQEFCVKIKML